jgi:hypothetical protein
LEGGIKSVLCGRLGRRAVTLYTVGESDTLKDMSLSEILHEIEALAPEERWKVLEHTRQLVEPEIPAEFTEGMEAIAKGETLDLDEAMPELRSE